MTCSLCHARRSKGDHTWMTCHRCVGGPYRLCPDCRPKHIATHVLREVGQPPMAPVQGPFPCGEVKCICTKGGCDHLGACSPEEVAALAKAPLEGKA